MPITANDFGADCIALSGDGESLYWSALGGRYLYSVPIARPREKGISSEMMAQASFRRASRRLGN